MLSAPPQLLPSCGTEKPGATPRKQLIPVLGNTAHELPVVQQKGKDVDSSVLAIVFFKVPTTM